MNQDFTVQKKKQYLTEKKIPAQAVSEKKNSCKLKIPPPPPITFLMVRPLVVRWAGLEEKVLPNSHSTGQRRTQTN